MKSTGGSGNDAGGSPVNKIGYFDCQSGISGDMILGVIVDCGVPLDAIREGLAALPIEGYELSARRVVKNNIAATQVEVVITDTVSERNLSEIISIIEESKLSGPIKVKSKEIFNRIGKTEAEIHGVAIETIHLHELGGLDTIIDVVGGLIGMEILGLNKIYASALPLGTGTVNTLHGSVPLPAPATLKLLEGVLVRGSELNKELVTPTGAALLTSIADEFSNIPAMRLLTTGYGAGKMDLPIPNVLRLLIGEFVEGKQTRGYPVNEELLVCLETNIDNMNPEIFSYLSERLFDTGALDVSIIPIFMKKNRPGTLVDVLCSEEYSNSLINILLNETKTLGVRKFLVNRYSVERKMIQVTTLYGVVQVKLAQKGENIWDFSPEYEDCKRLALKNNIPLMKVYRAADKAAEDYLTNQFPVE